MQRKLQITCTVIKILHSVQFQWFETWGQGLYTDLIPLVRHKVPRFTQVKWSVSWEATAVKDQAVFLQNTCCFFKVEVQQGRILRRHLGFLLLVPKLYSVKTCWGGVVWIKWWKDDDWKEQSFYYPWFNLLPRKSEQRSLSDMLKPPFKSIHRI